MPVKIVLLDSATPWLQWAMKEYPRYLQSGLKSLGWYTQKQIKLGIRSKAPGGQAYAPNTPAPLRRKIQLAFRKKSKNAYPVLGKLYGAVGYQYNKANSSVTIGWLSVSAVKIAHRLETGFETTVTQKMRGALLHGKLPWMAKKSKIETVARPTIGPMYDVLEPKFAVYLEEKIWEYIKGNKNRGVPKTIRSYYTVGGF